jgi:hypothetical protein
VTAAVWALEWRVAARRRRLAAFSAGVPLVLAAAIALGGAPPVHAAVVYATSFTLFGTFGAAVPWARDAERGFLTRLLLTGVASRALVVQRVIAGGLIDLVELAPAALVIVLAGGAGLGQATGLFLALAGGLLAANALGVWVATLADSLAETALLAAVSALVLLHAGGVFRTPTPGSAGAWVEHAVPFHYLHQALRAAKVSALPTGAPALPS